MNELTVEATPESIATVTDFIEKALSQTTCSLKILMQINVAIDEIISNIAQYAYAPNTGTVTVRLSISKDPNTVSLTFIDSGVPYNPLEKKDPDTSLSAEEREIGGLGIYIVKKSMDHIAYDFKDNQNILRITKNLDG